MDKPARFHAHTEELSSLGRPPVRGNTGDHQLEVGLTVTSREGRGQHKMEVTNSPNKWTKPCDGGSQDRWPSVTQASGPLWKVTKVTQLAGWGKTPTLESRTSHASYWLSTYILWTWHLTQLSFQPPSEVYSIVPITHKKLGQSGYI